MRIKVTKAHDLVIKETKNGRPLATVSFVPSDEPITTKREWGEELVKVGAAIEVKEPAKRKAGDSDEA